ncbi:MAG: PIG-L family deacetylase [Chthoniobacteraceae bacterium]
MNNLNGITLTAEDRLLIIAPHPDDESLGAGGLIQRAVAAGAELNVIFITDGDNNPWPQRYLEFRWNVSRADRLRWGKRRRMEAIDALIKLGAPPDCADFLSLPDQGLTKILLENSAQLIDPLSTTIQNWQPTLVIAPCIEDVHPDHCAIHVMLQHVLQGMGPLAPRALFYKIHGNGIPVVAPRLILTLTKQEQLVKRKAILAHLTQMALSKKRFLQYASPGEAYYQETGDSTPEAFHSAIGHGGELILRMHPYVVLRHRANILFAWEDDEGAFQSAAISLRQSRIIQTPTGPEIHVQPPVLPTDRRVYVKYQLKRIYFEQYGWQTLRMLSPTGNPRANGTPASVAV